MAPVFKKISSVPEVSNSWIPVPRIASEYVAVQNTEVSVDSYPCGSVSLIPSIHDTHYCQGILKNASNFASSTKCDIFEMKDNSGAWVQDLDEFAFQTYIESYTPDTGKVSMRAIFCYFERVQGTSFGLQLSITEANTQQMLKNCNVSPQFVPLLFGEPDYWAPGDFASYDNTGNLRNIEFFCQHPRWNIHKRQTPWCVYMTYDATLACTTYIIVCGSENPTNQTVKARLTASLTGASEAVTEKSHARDPYFLHCMIFHESFLEAKGIITSLRHRLYDELDKVDVYSKNTSNRKSLENLTIELHVISQDIDSLIASADMADMIATKMLSAHARCKNHLSRDNLKDKMVKVSDSITYLQSSAQSQKRWLLGLRFRKDTAMNLVFNLVTQQDSFTTTLIAHETKADSSSMKTIAALTMVFLPGTFISSIFSLEFIGRTPWWVFVAITIPLTVVVVIVWWFWTSYPVIDYVQTAVGKLKAGKSRQKISDSKV